MTAGTRAVRTIRRRRVLLGAKYAIAATLLYWLVSTGRLDFASYRVLASVSNLGLIGAATALQIIAFGIFIMRWWGLARAQELPIARAEVAQTGLRGLFTQLFLPGGIGADGVRILHLRTWYRDQLMRGLASLLTDRLSGLIGLVLLGAAACQIHELATGDRRLMPVTILFAGLIAAGFVFAALLWGALRFTPLARLWRMAVVASAIDALRAYARRKRAVVAAVAVSILGHGFTALASYFAIVALGDAPPLLGVLAITTVLNLVRMIPITPLGLGVADGAAEVLYAQIGLTNGAELQMLTRIISMLIFMFAGLAFFVDQPRRGND